MASYGLPSKGWDMWAVQAIRGKGGKRGDGQMGPALTKATNILDPHPAPIHHPNATSSTFINSKNHRVTGYSARLTESPQSEHGGFTLQPSS
ncbi:hypothetical protein F5887DRAFT_1083438 [Amanita rubescens]|nr:hypothetical protein F5887DRAFT_1083438 [Amanita rubescens]